MRPPSPSGLGEELAHLERTDSTVAKAAASLQRMYESMQTRGSVPRTRFRKSTADTPCEVIR